MIQVADTGLGVSGKLIDNLFEPFVTTKPQGLGLGLSISSGIVAAHGGRLGVESRPGEGAQAGWQTMLPVCCQGCRLGGRSGKEEGRLLNVRSAGRPLVPAAAGEAKNLLALHRPNSGKMKKNRLAAVETDSASPAIRLGASVPDPRSMLGLIDLSVLSYRG